MIFDLLAPPRAPGGGAKKSAVARLIHVTNSHTKFGWILSNGLGGDIVTDGQTDGRTDGRRQLQYPRCFFKKSVGINSYALKLCSEKEVSTGPGLYPIP